MAQGRHIAELSVDKNHVWEALRALYVVGQLHGTGRCAALYPARAGTAGIRSSPGRAHRAGDSIARKVIDRPSAGGVHISQSMKQLIASLILCAAPADLCPNRGTGYQRGREGRKGGCQEDRESTAKTTKKTAKSRKVKNTPQSSRQSRRKNQG